MNRQQTMSSIGNPIVNQLFSILISIRTRNKQFSLKLQLNAEQKHIQNYFIAKSTKEQDDLKNEITILQRKSTQLNIENQTLQLAYRKLKKENDEREYLLNERLKTLSYLEAIVDVLDKQKQTEHIDLDLVDNQEIKEDNQFSGLMKQNIQYQLSIEQLQGYQQELQFEIEKLKNQDSTWSCVRCQQVLQEGKNEKSCIYHPGRLKYYSCRQCGGDEYFTCCNKCRQCLKGCQNGLHKP